MVTIYVCVGSVCHLKGSYNIIGDLYNLIEERGLGGQITVKAALCLGNCTHGVSAKVDDNEVISLNQENVREFFEKLAAGLPAVN